VNITGTLATSGGLTIDATTESNIEAALDTLSNVTTVGALNAGSITSGFGAIDIGADNFTTTGVVNTDTLTLTNTGTLNGLDAIDATGEATLEAALDIAGDVDGTGLGAVDLDEVAVEAELESVIDLADLQGAVTDAQVPNNITIDLATLSSTQTVVDSTDATSFVAIYDSATGSLAAKTDAALTYDSTTGTLATTGGLTTATLTGGATASGTTKALQVNNGTSTGNIFEAQDNGTARFTVADGGGVTATGTGFTVALTSGNLSIEDAGGGGLFTNPSGGWTWLEDGDGHNRFFMPYTASNSTINNSVRIDGHRHAATVTGYGTGLLFTGRDTTTQDAEMVRVAGVWTDATHATRSAALVFQTVNNAGALTERMRIGANGSVQLNSYGSGTYTGTPAYTLQVDSSGNIIEGSAVSGLTTGTTTIASGTDTRVLFNDGGVLGEDAGLTYNKTTDALSATTFIGALTGNASTATALAVNPTDCAANQYAISIVANGNLTCASIADADVPNNITIDLATLASTVTFADAGGDTTTFLALGTSATGSLAPATDAGLSYNATTDALTVSGAITGSNLSGTNTGDQTITLTGDVTGSGTGSFAATIADNSVDGTDIALGSDAQGDIMYYSGTDWVRLAPGTSGQFLKTQGAAANVIWDTPTGSGDITDVGNCSTGACFTGASGTILTFDDPDGDQTLTYDTTNNEFDFSDDVNITGTLATSGGLTIDATTETNIEAAVDIAGDVDGTGLGAVDLDEVAVEAELESVLDLADLQGAVTDAQVPNNITIDLATLSSTQTVVDGTDATSFVAIYDSATGSLAAKTDAALTYDATTGALSATTFIGALTGNASTATALAANPTDCGANTFATTIAANGNLTCASIADADVPNSITIDLATLASTVTFADAAADTTTFVALGTSATGSLAPATDAGLSYNASTDALTLSGSQIVPLISGSTAANGDITINGTSDATKATSYVILQETGGNVGIGTASPTYKLQSEATTTAAFYGHSTTSHGLMGISDGVGGNYGVYGLTTDTGGGAMVGFAQNGTTFGIIGYANAFSFYGSGNLYNSGSIGIATTAPDKALEINSATGANMRLTYNDADGSAANYSDFTVGSTGGLTLTAAGTNPKTLVVNNGTSTGNIFEAQDNGTPVFTVADGGVVTATSAIAANGGITFDASTDTIGAFTAGGTIDMATNILTNIGNTGTDFVATTGALNLAGVLTANGGISIGTQNLTGSTGNIDYTNFDVTGSNGNTDIGGTITAGSGNTVITLGTGMIDADAITLFAGGDGVGITTSATGLETESDGLTLLQGCADGEILKWEETTDTWDCAADASGGGGLTTGTTTITSGTDTRVLFNDGGVLGEDAGFTYVKGTDALTLAGSIVSPALNGSTAANGDITINGTTSATKTTSYVNLQNTGGLVGIGMTTPTSILHVTNAVGGSTKTAIISSGTSTGNIFEVQDNGNAVFTIVDGGNVTVTAGTMAPSSSWNLTAPFGLSLNANASWSFGVSDSSGDTTLNGYSSRHRYLIDYSENSTTAKSSGHVFSTNPGATSAGFGSGIVIAGQSSTTANRDMVRLSGVWTTATDASRTSAITFDSVNNAGALEEILRLSKGELELGVDVNGSAINQTFKAHDGITGTDISGANLTIAAGRGTGSGAGGALVFQTAPTLGSGTTAQTLADRLTIAKSGSVQLNSYGSGTYTGTPAYTLQVDSSGNIIEGSAVSGLTTGTTTIASGTDTRVLFNDGGVLGEDAGLTYNKTTDALTATTFIGALTGNASTATALAANPSDCAANTFATTIAANGNLTCASISDADVPNSITIDLATLATTVTVSDAAGDTTTFPTLAGSATGSLGVLTDPGLSYNATTNALTATTFIGALTGNADTVTTNANLTGAVTSTGNATSLGSFTTSAINTALSDNDIATLAGTETLSGKTLTAPRFADLGFIADTSGNEMLIFDSVGSAVNEIRIGNAGTGNGVFIRANGDDGPIDFSIDAKGAGDVIIGGVSTGNILFGGGFGLTGCTIVAANGNISCDGVAAFSGGLAIDATTETNIEAAVDIAGDVDGTGLGAVDLDEVAVEAELESVLDLADLQGAVTDSQVPNNITIDLATLASTVTFADAGGDTTTFVALGTSATGSLAPATDAGLSYNATTDALTVGGSLAANGGITFDASTDTVGAFTAAGTIDMNTQTLAGSTGDINYTNFDVTGSNGNTDIGGTITAGSGNTVITLGTGMIDADAITLFAGGDGVGITTSATGLETESDGLTLLQGCADGEILKWEETTDTWDCAADASGGGGGLTVGGAITSGAANRVLYEGAGNLLAESANFTYDGTTLGVATSSTTASNAAISGTQTGGTTGTDYGGFFSNTGAATRNVGLYTTASGGTTNLGLNVDAGQVLIGGTTLSTSTEAKVNIVSSMASNGSTTAIAGIHGEYTMNPSAGGTQVGNRFVMNNAPTSSANTAINQIIRTIDNTALANTVRGIEVVSSAGSNTAGTNTGIRSTGATFGVQAITTGLAGGVSLPAGLYAENTGTTQGDVARFYTGSMTSAPAMLQVYHDTSAFTGDALLMDMAVSGGSTSFTGDFLDFKNASVQKFKVTSAGVVSMGLGGTASTNAVCSSLANATGPTAGTAYEIRDCNAAPAADYAEMYPVETGIEFGDIVVTGTQMVNTYDVTDGNVDWTKVKGVVTQLVKSNEDYQRNVIGIVVDNYGDFTSAGHNIKDEDNPMPVALNGRVPVKVSNASAAISPGDYITTSLESGKAMKAVGAGTVIGKALEAWAPDSGKDTVMVFVEQGYYNGPSSLFAGLTFDENGNATFDGEITATKLNVDEINLHDVEGMESLTDQITLLSNGQQAMTMTASSVQALSNALNVVSDGVLVLEAKDAEFETRIANIENAITTGIFEDANGLVTLDKLLVTGDSTFEGETTFNGLVFLNADVTFAQKVVFDGATEFNVPPLFNADTAGFALIHEGANKVEVVFDTEYATTPIVNTTISFEEEDAVDEEIAQELFTAGVQSLVINKSKTGFTIILNQNAPRDIRFSWTALAVKDAKIFEGLIPGLVIDSEDEPSPEEDTTTEPTPEPTPEPEPTGDPETGDEGLDEEIIGDIIINSGDEEGSGEPATEPEPAPEPTPEPAPESAPEPTL
jgi:hypothetical protein